MRNSTIHCFYLYGKSSFIWKRKSSKEKVIIYSWLEGVNKSRLSTSSRVAILSRVFKSGWTLLLHHLLTVQADLPTCSANHLLVLSCSARTAFKRFNLAMLFNKDKVWRKDIRIIWHRRIKSSKSYRLAYDFYEIRVIYPVGYAKQWGTVQSFSVTWFFLRELSATYYVLKICFAIRIHFTPFRAWLRTRNVAVSWFGFGSAFYGFMNIGSSIKPLVNQFYHYVFPCFTFLSYLCQDK